MRNVIVDLQFFKTSAKELKELAIYDGSQVAHYIFKPPYPFKMLAPTFQTQAKWLMDHHHSIPWDVGFVPTHLCSEILRHLLQNVDMVFVKGKEKADYVRKIISGNVFELSEEKTCLQRMKPSCLYHTSDLAICALTNCYYLYNIYMMEIN